MRISGTLIKINKKKKISDFMGVKNCRKLFKGKSRIFLLLRRVGGRGGGKKSHQWKLFEKKKFRSFLGFQKKHHLKQCVPSKVFFGRRAFSAVFIFFLFSFPSFFPPFLWIFHFAILFLAKPKTVKSMKGMREEWDGNGGGKK